MTRLRRVGLGVIDQALSSVSNVLFLVAVARQAGLEEFGAVSFAYALFAFGLAVQRASIGTLISLSAGSQVAAPIRLSVLWASVVCGLGLILGATIGDGGSGAYYVVVGGCLLIYPQDLLRYSALAEGHAGRAVASDGTWAVVTLALLAASLAGASLEATLMTALWAALGGGAALAVIALPLNAGGRSGDRRWLRDHAAELRILGPDALLSAFAPLLLAAVMVQAMSLGDVAAVRGAGTLLGPTALVFSALPAVVLPELARVLGDDRSRLATAQAVFMGLLVLGWGACLALVPDAAGQQVLGETWAGARTVLPLAVLELVVWGLASGPIALLSTYRRWRTLALIRVAYLTTVALGLAATVSSGSVWRVMSGMVVASVVNYVILTVASRHHARRGPGPESDVPEG